MLYMVDELEWKHIYCIVQLAGSPIRSGKRADGGESVCRSLFPCLLIQKTLNNIPYLPAPESALMFGAFHAHKAHVGSAFFQPSDHFNAVGKIHHRVVIAVGNQERNIGKPFLYIADGAHFGNKDMVDASSAKDRKCLQGVLPGRVILRQIKVVGKIRRPEAVDDGIHTVGGVRIFFCAEFLPVPGKAQKKGSVAAGGGAEGVDALRVNMILAGVCAEKTDGGFYVL